MLRSFDERSHSYPGYNLLIDGWIDDERRQFWLAISKAAQAKRQFRVDDEVSGKGVTVDDPRMEVAELYKVSALKPISRLEADGTGTGSPWHSLAHLRRKLLVELGRGEEALFSAWEEYEARPSWFAYRELMAYVRLGKEKKWYDKALGIASPHRPQRLNGDARALRAQARGALIAGGLAVAGPEF